MYDFVFDHDARYQKSVSKNMVIQIVWMCLWNVNSVAARCSNMLSLGAEIQYGIPVLVLFSLQCQIRVLPDAQAHSGPV